LTYHVFELLGEVETKRSEHPLEGIFGLVDAARTELTGLREHAVDVRNEKIGSVE